MKSDCTHIQGEIRPLIVRGAIREVHWYDLEGYKTTPRGTLLSHEIMKERREGARERVNRMLDHLPATCVRYILERLVFSKDWEGRHERAANGYFRHGADATLCLLDDPRLKTSRDEVFNKLVDLGLAEKASGYVSTGRGSTHEPVFVFSPEVKEHLAAYLQRQQSSGPILPDAMEQLHNASHVLRDWVSFGQTGSLTTLLNRCRVAGVEVQPFVNELAEKTIIELSRDTVTVLNVQNYTNAVIEAFLSPIVDYLFSAPPPVKDKPEEKALPVDQPPRPSAVEERARPPEQQSRPVPVEAKLLSVDQQPPPAVVKEPPHADQSFRALLGSGESGSGVYWEPLAVPNPHLLIVGSPGTGKTQTAKAVMFEAVHQHLRSFVIDFANEYGDPHLVQLVLKPGDAVTVNPLDLLEGGPTDVVFRVSGILKKIFRLGDQQEGLVRNAVKNTYAAAGITDDPKTWSRPVPQFSGIKEYLESPDFAGKGMQANLAQRTLTRLEPLFDLKVFSADTQVMFDRMLEQGATLYLRDLPTEETKLAVAEFFLRWLWHRIIKEGEIRNKLRLLLIMDEAHKLAYENSPVADFLRQGRKYGVAVVLSTQQPDDFQSKELAFQNTAYHISFGCNSDKHAQAMARQMVVGRHAQQQIAEAIRTLKPFEALVAGQASSNVDRVRIRPYHERVQP